MHADDVVIFAETQIVASKNLAAVSEYCLLNKLTLNKIKTKIVVFKRGRLGDKLMDVKYEENPGEIVKKFFFHGAILKNYHF